MVDIDDQLIEEAVHEGQTTTALGTFDILERHYDDEPGVPWAAVEAYANALASRSDYRLDVDAFLGDLADRRTDAETWEEAGLLYEVSDDRVSQYPARWHERLGGSTDAAEYVEFLAREVSEFGEQVSDRSAGGAVPEEPLINVIEVVGRVDRDTAVAAIGRARDEGEIVEDADQHPDAGVYPADEAEDLR